MPYLQYWDVNNLYDRQYQKKLPVNNLKWVKDISKFDECFIKSHNEERDKGYFLEVHVQYPENLHNLHIDLPFLPERKVWVRKLVANLHDKTKYVIHMRNLKPALNHGLVFKKNKFNKKLG